jgi:hypothetical protein
VITNLIPSRFSGWNYVSDILAHLQDITDYHFIATHQQAWGGEYYLPEVGGHVVVLLTGGEYYHVPAHLDEVHRIWACYTRRENERLRALPLGPSNDVPIISYKPPAERNLDVFFSGQRQHRGALPQWRDMLRQAGFKTEILITKGFLSGLDGDEYAEKLMDARIALCPTGEAPETFRHYEAARFGCAVISHPLPGNCLYQNSPMRQVSYWAGELVDTVRTLLANIQEESERSLKWWNDKYEPAAVAQRIRTSL